MAFVSKRLNAVGRLGPDLVELRERVGLSLDEAAHRTKIAPSIIRALETESWNDLPDQVYAERLLRSYVSFFGSNESYYLHKFREAREAATRLHEQAQGEAKKNADRLIADAKAVITTEKNAALRDVKAQVAMFSLQVAEKLMRKNLSDDKAQKELIDSYVKDIKVN